MIYIRPSRSLVVIASMIIIGCAAPESLYYWGDYEELIYQMYIKPGLADTGTQILKLKEDINKASAVGKFVPPGLHAHLGYMYFLQGDTSDAILELATEKKLFPESSRFVDGLLGRIKK
jgi:hypothetical protein